MKKIYRAGLIGCGRIAGAHVNGYRSSDRYELVAVADIKREAAEGVCERFDIPTHYLDYREMLEREDLDVVSIATWAGSHAEITVPVAAAGVKGILCEKPMAPSLGEASAMIEVCAENGVKLAIGHQHRFDPSWVEARNLVAAGAIGRPTLATIHVSDGLLNNGTHYIDGIRFILGDPEAEWAMAQVERKTDRYERGEPIEDRLVGLAAFAQGTRALVDVDLPAVEGEPASPYTFHGTDGRIELDRQGLRLLNADGWQEMDFPQPVPSHSLQAQEFARWMDGEIEDYRGSAERAYQTVAVMMGFYQSVRSKGVVTFPLTIKESPLKLLIEAGELPVEQVGKYDIRA